MHYSSRLSSTKSNNNDVCWKMKPLLALLAGVSGFKYSYFFEESPKENCAVDIDWADS